MYPLDQLLPQQWAKDKKKKPEQIALQISSEHRKLHNTPETQAKYRVGPPPPRPPSPL